MTLRDRIKRLANERGLSLPTLEEKLGFGNGTIVRWDKSSPTAEKLRQVADYLGVSVDYLLGRDSKDAFSDMDTDVRAMARDIQKLGSGDKVLLKTMIAAMKKAGKEAREDG